MSSKETDATKVEEAFEQVWLEQRRVDCLATQRLEKEFAEADLPPLAWFEVLYMVGASEDPLRPRDLLGSVHVTKSGLTRLLSRIEEAGLIVRSICPSDRRGTFFEITEDGHGKLKQMRAIWGQFMLDHWATNMNAKQAVVMSSSLGSVSTSILGVFEEEGACDLEIDV